MTDFVEACLRFSQGFLAERGPLHSVDQERFLYRTVSFERGSIPRMPPRREQMSLTLWCLCSLQCHG